MAIKISDLSVGDWVRTKDGNVTVDIISPLEVVVMKDYGNLCACKIEDIEPIPITAEILENNGFELSSSYWSIYNDNDDYIEIWRNKDKWYLSVNSVEYTLCDLHWVHQIQHLMRVWGVDKEINL